MADDPDDQIAAAVAGITAPPTPDPKGLLDIAVSVRAQIASAKADPTHPAFGRPDVIAKMEQGLALSLARANVTEPVFDPQTAAAEAHDRAFTMGELHPNLAEMVDDRLEQLETANSEEGLARMAGDLRRQLGATEYEKLVADATGALNPGEKLPPAVRADLLTLRLLAGHGRYVQAYENTKPRSVT